MRGKVAAYGFAACKERVIGMLTRVTRVTVETQAIEAMRKAAS